MNHVIEQLPMLEPSTSRADRTRVLCHRKLARHIQPRAHKRFVVERAILLSFGALYLSSLALDAIRILTIR